MEIEKKSFRGYDGSEQEKQVFSSVGTVREDEVEKEGDV